MTRDLLSILPEELMIYGQYETREVFINNKWLDPEYSQQIRNHSPDGFNWGYGGSGPAQLALAILLKFMLVEDALSYYQEFKWKVIATLPGTDFNITINLKNIITEIMQSKIMN